MNIDMMITWILALLPLSISPGPANILFAASGSTFGHKATIPFWLGTNSVCLLQTLAVGFGLNLIIENTSHANSVIQWLGITFLLFLSYRFFHAAMNSQAVIKPLTFLDGLVVESLNMKFLMIPVIMFSSVYASQTPDSVEILGLSLALVALTASSNLVWIMAGNFLSSLLKTRQSQTVQGYIFGFFLLITAGWLTINHLSSSA